MPGEVRRVAALLVLLAAVLSAAEGPRASTAGARREAGGRGESGPGEPVAPALRAPGLGLAAKYPGDVGIKAAPTVIFADGFESGDISAWNGGARKAPKPVEVISDPHNVHSGKFALQSNYVTGQSQAGGVSHSFLPGFDEIHVRWYVKFSPNFVVENDLHHQSIEGRKSRGQRVWVGAGSKPNGDDAFTAEVDAYTNWKKLPGAGAFHFYSYFPTMKVGWQNKYWGNTDEAKNPILIQPDTWYCVEHRCKVNTVNADRTYREDGEEELWVNGIPQVLVEGRVWRTSDILLCNAVGMGFWMTEAPKQDQQMWVDDVVVAHEYVGPMAAGQPSGEAK